MIWTILRKILLCILISFIAFAVFDGVCGYYLQRMRDSGALLLANDIVRMNVLPYIVGALSLIIGLTIAFDKKR